MIRCSSKQFDTMVRDIDPAAMALDLDLTVILMKYQKDPNIPGNKASWCLLLKSILAITLQTLGLSRFLSSFALFWKALDRAEFCIQRQLEPYCEWDIHDLDESCADLNRLGPLSQWRSLDAVTEVPSRKHFTEALPDALHIVDSILLFFSNVSGQSTEATNVVRDCQRLLRSILDILEASAHDDVDAMGLTLQ